MGNPFRVCGRAGKSREEEEERLYTNKRMDEMIRGSGKKRDQTGAHHLIPIRGRSITVTWARLEGAFKSPTTLFCFCAPATNFIPFSCPSLDMRHDRLYLTWSHDWRETKSQGTSLKYKRKTIRERNERAFEYSEYVFESRKKMG